MEKGLNINSAKTKVMVMSKCQQIPRTEIRCGDQVVEQVDSSKYLGSTVTSNVKCETEIRRRIEIAKCSFINLKKLLKNGKLSIKTRKRLAKSRVWSTLLYGAGTRTLSGAITKKLEAVEMWFWRRLLKIPWTDRKTNAEVLNIVGEEKCLVKEVRKRQLKFFGHVMRREGLEKGVVTGLIEGSRGKGRPRDK